MKSLLLIPLLGLPLLWLAGPSLKKAEYSNHAQPVNAVLGDRSFVETFGHSPTASTDEQLRIRTHLAYVETLLRTKDVQHLSPDLRKNRENLLNHLHTYIRRGAFPKNYDHPGQRKPCFIDRDGNICAVGYLVEQSAGRPLAERINSLFQYEEIQNMQLPELAAWVAQSGLTLEECAMIQPMYDFPIGSPSQPIHIAENRVPPAYGLGSALLGGVNLSVNAINLSQLNNPSSGRLIPVIGIASGTASTIWGMNNIRETRVISTTMGGQSYYTTNESIKTLSMLNITVGTFTVLTSAYKLLTHRKQKDKKFAWDIHGTPAADGLAFSIRQRF
ncbi:MAG: hypothetical protein MUD08_05075 [Cytophagales bacterium]|jgi:hypothetical protein|nr:hypothetical protein [Cytophagales bacterium]